MPRGPKVKYSDKQKRQAEHIEKSYEDHGAPPKVAEKRAWQTINKQSGGGEKAVGGRPVSAKAKKSCSNRIGPTCGPVPQNRLGSGAKNAHTAQSIVVLILFLKTMASKMFTPNSNHPITRVVVVEDVEGDRELLMRQLRKNRIEEHVRFFSDGTTALQFLSDLPPPAPFCDLIAIFLDLKLPGLSGIKLLREVRKMPRVKNTPVIIMSASINPKDFEDCQELKVAAFIPKPVTFELFSQAITRLPHLPTFAVAHPNIPTRLYPD